MTWRSLSLVLLLAPLALTGCPPESPDDSDTDIDTNDVDTGTGTDTDTEGDTEEDTDAPSVSCHELPSSLPPFAGPIDPALVTEAAPTTDAGLGTIISQATDEAQTVSIPVNGAVVTTLDYNAEYDDTGIAHRFYLEDASGAVYVRLDFDNATGWPVAPGDIVNFTATSILDFNGVIQVGELENLTVVSSSNPVHVVEGNGIALDTVDDINVVHHLYGELTSAPTGCGGSNECFDFETRDAAGNSTISTFRVRNDRANPPFVQGDCVEVYAPLTQFSSEPQFNINNFQWVRWFANVDE